ncbi:MAG: sulfatase [Armatimonadetes bacterium]|nr:sulfatase [Armatimonadota bacterium]
MNILLIVVDTLRASRLGCYGYPLPVSPRIDALAREGLLFENCIAPGIPTTPAHTTLYTGLHPIEHNIVSHGGAVDLDRKIDVLPELLQQTGVTTAAVDNLVDIKPWLGRGYEFYINPSFRHKLRLMITAEEVNARAIPWLMSHSRESFFLFVHYWDPHTPYAPPTGYERFYPKSRDRFSAQFNSMERLKEQPLWRMFGDIWFNKLGPVTDADYVSSLYDAEIRYVDDGIAALLEALEASGAADDTMVVLVGDHGESLTEHDIYFDHHGLYEDVVRVPLIIRAPGRVRAGNRHPGMVSHIDVAPTIMAAAGGPVSPAMRGRDLLAGSLSPDEPIVCCECTWQAKWGVRTSNRKYIESRKPDHHNMPLYELYDLVADPNEQVNLAPNRPDEVQQWHTWLNEWITHALERCGRSEDPLEAQELTLGKRWYR